VSLQAELARLLNLITDARAAGNSELAELLTESAAKCLMKLADLGASVPDERVPRAPEQQPVAQQQQQIQPDSDEPKN
jgi:hypothetical protein